MPSSAQLGDPPANSEDYWIVKGIIRNLLKIPDGKLDPSNGIPMFLKLRKPGTMGQNRDANMIAGMSVAIALVIIITGTRLSLRAFRRDLKWGPDDWFIIPAAVCIQPSLIS